MAELKSDHLARLIKWYDWLFNDEKGKLKPTMEDIKILHRLEIMHEDEVEMEEELEE